MTFAGYLRRKGIKRVAAAAALAISPATVTRICQGMAPKPALGQRIVAWTGGAVGYAALYGAKPKRSRGGATKAA